MRRDSSDDLIRGYDKLITFFTNKGIVNEVIRIDNQTSVDLQTYFEQVAKIKYRLVPPGNHRTLHAERDIRTWKNHFIATRAGVDKSFPTNQWDALLDQVDLTLNLLRPCEIIPNKSAWEYVCGPYDYKTNPIGPAGAKVLVYENPNERETFADHGVEGFYVGPAWNHYRCFRVWIPSTRKFRISDTLSWHIDDAIGLLSNHSPIDAVHHAIDILTVQLQLCTTSNSSHNTISEAHANILREGISALENIAASSRQKQHPLTDDYGPPPGLHSVSIRSEPTQRVVVPVSVTPKKLTIALSSESEPLPRVSVPSSISPNRLSLPLATEPEPLPRVSVENVPIKRSRNLRSNRNHVITDSLPTVHTAVKVHSHKGSDNKPMNPLRFRVRWEGHTASEDTWEPWDNVKDCSAAITYVNSKPKLWYLLDSSLLHNKAFNAEEIEPMPWYKVKLAQSLASVAVTTPEPEEPLTRARAKAIAQSVMSIQQFALYELLGMPVTQEMHNSLANQATALSDSTDLYANAAGDMDDEGNELKYKQCIIGPDKEHWITASVTEFHRLFHKFNTIRMTTFSNIPKNKQSAISYYNPQCKTKIKPGGKQSILNA